MKKETLTFRQLRSICSFASKHYSGKRICNHIGNFPADYRGFRSYAYPLARDFHRYCTEKRCPIILKGMDVQRELLILSSNLFTAHRIIRRLLDKVNCDKEYDMHKCPNKKPCGICKLVAKAEKFISNGKRVKEDA